MTTHARIAVTALAALLLLAGCKKGVDANTKAADVKVSAAPIAPPAGQQWTDVANVSPEGGYVLGNPNAPVKLIEFGSLTCPHCAEFSKTGSEGLMKYVRDGQVSWEFRTFLLNSLDVPLSMMARCQGPAPFFKLAEQLYQSQSEWFTKFQNISKADSDRINALQPNEVPAAIAKASGMDGWFKVRGVPGAKLDQCLSSQKELDTLEGFVKQGSDAQIPGTPAFLINGRLVQEAASWDRLEPALKAAIG